MTTKKLVSVMEYSKICNAVSKPIFKSYPNDSALYNAIMDNLDELFEVS